ncbi:MAG TPA: hypothetical protein VHM20_03710, partial [Gammaproteobacteria bacterium]|nr:hypothetical protein [Gammaproteobacteria bacterium]
PNHFSKYDYSLRVSFLNDEPVYEVSFDPLKNGSYKGRFWLDKKTLAYLQGEYELSQYGINQWRLQHIFQNTTNEKRSYKVKYFRQGTQWVIQLANTDASFEFKSSPVHYTAEFVATKYNAVDSNPISESNAITYSQVYTMQEEKFSDKYWSKPETVARERSLEETLAFLYKKDTIKLIEPASTATIPPAAESMIVRKTKKQSTFSTKLVTHLSTGFSIGVAPIYLKQGTYFTAFDNKFGVGRKISNAQYITTLTTEFGYHLTRGIFLTMNITNNVATRNKFELITIGGEWRKRIAGWKKPFSVTLGLSFYKATLENVIGETLPSGSFKVKNHLIDSKKINVGIGEKRNGMISSLGLVYKFKPRFSWFAYAETSVLSSQKNLLFIKETSGSLFKRSSVKTNSSDNNVVIMHDEAPTTDTGIHLQNMRLMFAFGLRLGMQ